MAVCEVLCVVFFVFFFQAEDGIRDVAVTGVQTCALPISRWCWSLQLPDWDSLPSWRVSCPRGARRASIRWWPCVTSEDSCRSETWLAGFNHCSERYHTDYGRCSERNGRRPSWTKNCAAS